MFLEDWKNIGSDIREIVEVEQQQSEGNNLKI
jgi:hypothetical protein